MSKSTNRYGKITFHSQSSLTATPTIPDTVKQQQSRLDRISQLLFGCKYFNLRDKVRIRLHETINGHAAWTDDRTKLIKAGLL